MPCRILSETAHRFLQIFAFFGKNGDCYRLPEAHSTENGDRYLPPEAHSVKNGDRYRLPEARSAKNGGRFLLPEAHFVKNGDRYRFLRPRLAIFFDFLLIRGLGCFVFSIFEPSYRGGVPVFGISEASHPLFA